MARTNDKRERLVDAAADLFWSRGFDATSLADIADAAQVPLGNVYYYFKTKTAIARAVADLFVIQSQSLLASLEADAGGPAAKLERFIDVLAGSSPARAERGCPIARAVTDFRQHDDGAARAAAQALEVLVGWVKGMLSALGDEEPGLHARRLIAGWQGGIVLAHASGDISRLDEAIVAMREIVRDASKIKTVQASAPGPVADRR